MIGKISFVVVLLLCLTSCFEVVEDITFKKNGSGTLKLIVNMSQSRSEINTLMKMDSSSGYEIPNINGINSYLDQTVQTLKTTEGLSNISIKRDFKNWIFILNVDFKSSDKLATGLKNINTHFAIDKSLLLRNVINFDGKKMSRETENLDEETRRQLNKPTEKKILSSAKYTTIYRFETTIAKCTNIHAKISPSKKAIMLQSNILNIINQKETIQNQIILNEP